MTTRVTAVAASVGTAASVLLTSAYVTTVVVDDPRLWLAGGAALLACAAFLGMLPSGPWRDVLRSGVHYQACFVALAWALDAVRVYCVAYAAAILLLAWIDLAHARGLVGYDPTTARFVVTRSCTYALLRTLSHVAAREWDAVPSAVERLTPFVLSGAETAGMYVLGPGDAYTFGSHTPEFWVYSALKAAVFLLLPELEGRLVAHPPAWWTHAGATSSSQE